jgi:soluble lytic murein transglycosylase-like protein
LVFSIQQANALPKECLQLAAQTFGHDTRLLHAITLVESGGNCNAISKPNANGSYDIGCMQINSAWLPTLNTRFGISQSDLLDPCTNVAVGAWVLAHNKRRLGNTWRAVGAYNATTESKRKTYSWKVHDKLASLR